LLIPIEHFSAHGSEEGTRVPRQIHRRGHCDFPLTLFLGGGGSRYCVIRSITPANSPYGGSCSLLAATNPTTATSMRVPNKADREP
jgi:hypothetical protein